MGNSGLHILHQNMFCRNKVYYKTSLISVLLFLIIYILYARQRNKISLVSWIGDNALQSDESFKDAREIKMNLIVNFTNFNYKIKSTACEAFGTEMLGVILVTSYVGHDDLRSSHRQAISQKKLQDMGLTRVFLLAEIPRNEKYITQSQIIDENLMFKDIVQGNFVEAYRNLTYKHIMGLKWAALECQKAKFVIKVDDDIVFDIFYIKNYLEGMEIKGNTQDFLAGYILNNKEPIRLKGNKWYVRHDEFNENYPNYLSGWFYMTNINTAIKLVGQSQITKFFWIDDAYVTGILRRKLGIPLVRLNHWFSANSQFLDCCIRGLRKSYECNYYVGPNDGDNTLIIKFVHGVEKCYFDECVKRPPDMPLKFKCVAEAKHFVKDHGEALVRAIKL